jgi:VWFA-related protein
MFRRLGAAAAGLLLVAIVSFGVSAQEGELRASLVSVNDAEFPEAKAILNIEDASGEPATSLPAESFTVTLGGTPAAVRAAELATSEDAPLDVLIVIDTSGSMEGAPLASAKAAAKAFIGDLPPGDRVAIESFGDDVTIVLDFTEDRAQAAAAIDGLVALGNTALYQATAVASYKMAQSPASRKAVVLLSDGADFGGRSTATREEALGIAGGGNVPFFTIAQGTDLDRAYLQQLAESTRGRYLEAPNPEDLHGLYTEVGRFLRSQYVVTFDATAATGLAEVPISVVVRLGERNATASGTYVPSGGFTTAVVLTGIAPGEHLAETREIVAEIVPPARGFDVTWFVDDAIVTTTPDAPHVFRFDPADFGDGPHTVRAVLQVGPRAFEGAVAVTSTAPAGGGGLPIVPIAIGALLVLVAGGVAGWLHLRARVRSGVTIGSLSADQRIKPITSRSEARRADAPEEGIEQLQPLPEAVGEPTGVLIARSGDDAGTRYPVGANPVSVGAGGRCAVRIDDAELSSEEARIWVRGGYLVVHRLTRLSVIASDGTSGGWSILEPGDSLNIGRHGFEFQLVDDAAATPDESAEIPNVLRDPTPADAEANAPVRLPELMPRDAGGFPPEDARAS